jgi:hypothetical protein
MSVKVWSTGLQAVGLITEKISGAGRVIFPLVGAVGGSWFQRPAVREFLEKTFFRQVKTDALPTRPVG